jgi:AcrR family transcriptional regulator
MPTSSVKPDTRSDPRAKLLAAAVHYVAANGLGDLSLRELAAAIGTSHRMLIYHFGSKEGLLVAIVQAVEADQRRFFADFAADPGVTPLDAARAFWRRVADPALAANVRLFFELYGQALQGRPGTTGLLDDIVDSWVRPLTEYRVAGGMPQAVVEADARLSVAVMRGLLLDLAATGQREAVEAAFERYLSFYTPPARKR